MALIDNKNQTMHQALINALSASDKIDIQVGYFYFSGFELLATHFKDKKVRILVGKQIDPKAVPNIIAMQQKTGKPVDLERFQSWDAPNSHTEQKEKYFEGFSKLFEESQVFDSPESQQAFKIFEQKIGIHSPLLTRKEYDRIQTIIQSRSGKKQPLKELPKMGVFKCSFCKGSITGERHTRHYLNGKSQEFCYYRCSRKGPGVKELGKCKEKGLTEKETERQVMDYIDDIDQVPEFLEWLKKVLKRQNQVMYQQLAKEQELQTKRRAELTKQKFELRAMKNEGFFPVDAEYQKQKEELLKLEQILNQEIVTTDDSVWDALFDNLCHFAKTVRELYQTDDPIIKRMVVEIIGLNFKLEDKKLKIEAKSAFIAMHRVKKDLWEKNLWIEPQNATQSEAKIPLSQGSFDHSLLSGAGDRT